MMITELPYEIWLHILSFLDPKSIRQLCFVNTFLYNLSLDDYYRITQVGYPFPFVTDNAPLRDLGNAKRARVLIIRRGSIYPQSPCNRLGSRRSVWKLIKAKFSRMRRHTTRHEPKASLLDAVLGLTSLTTLDVSLPYNFEDPFFHSAKLNVIKAGWPVFAANLTTLYLDVPLEEIHLILLSHIVLLQLEKFSIVLHTFHATSESYELIRTSLLPFLIDHGPTLRSLKLFALEDLNMSSMLTSLQHMPYLSDLDIAHFFLGSELTSFIGHHQFLEAHGSHLQHLTLEFMEQPSLFDIDMSEFFNQEWCRVLLPELQTLSFGLSPRFEVPHETAIPYFQRHIPTVKSLTIRSLNFSHDQFSSILTGPKPGEYRLTGLGTLDIQILCFSPAFLSLLVDKTPHLRLLRLKASIIGPDKQPEPWGRNRVPEFCEALQSSSFPEWGLCELQIEHLHGPVTPSLRNQCKIALFRALPKLKEFCGLGPEGSWPEEEEMELISLPSIPTVSS